MPGDSSVPVYEAVLYFPKAWNKGENLEFVRDKMGSCSINNEQDFDFVEPCMLDRAVAPVWGSFTYTERYEQIQTFSPCSHEPKLSDKITELGHKYLSGIYCIGVEEVPAQTTDSEQKPQRCFDLCFI